MKQKGKMILTLVALVVLALVVAAGSAAGADDDDGMDDAWEDAVGLNSTNKSDADADPDNDGFTNREEFDAGTDPFDKDDSPGKEKAREKGSALILLGVALCIGIPGIMSAVGLYVAGVSAMGMTTEHPDRFGKGLVLQALPMTQGVYGLVFAILLLLGAGYIGGSGDAALLTNVNVGWGAIMVGLTIGLTSVSAIPQGLVSASGASGVGRNPDVFAKGIIYAVMPETMAVFGFLIALFITMGVGLL